MKGLVHVQIGRIYIYIGMQHQSEIWEKGSEEEKAPPFGKEKS